MPRTVFAVFLVLLCAESSTLGKFLNTTDANSRKEEGPNPNANSTRRKDDGKSTDMLHTTNAPRAKTSPQDVSVWNS